MHSTVVNRNEKIYLNGVEYSHPAHVQFIKDMQSKGLNIELRVTFMYGGPCVLVRDKKKVTDNTSVRCGFEPKGVYFRIFPQESDPIVKDIAKNASWL